MFTEHSAITQNAPPSLRFVSERDLFEITQLTPRTWQKFRRRGTGPRWYKLGGSVKYRLDEVMAWVESNAVGGETA
jgi:predicted DNA-binding transcriptional regulator AlpA